MFVCVPNQGGNRDYGRDGRYSTAFGFGNEKDNMSGGKGMIIEERSSEGVKVQRQRVGGGAVCVREEKWGTLVHGEESKIASITLSQRRYPGSCVRRRVVIHEETGGGWVNRMVRYTGRGESEKRERDYEW